MRRDTETALNELTERLTQNKRQLRNELAGWSLSSEVLAKKYDNVICEIQTIIAADRGAERVAEEASGFEVLRREAQPNGDLHQTVRYRNNGREQNCIYTRESMLRMTAQEFRRKVDGYI